MIVIRNYRNVVIKTIQIVLWTSFLVSDHFFISMMKITESVP